MSTAIFDNFESPGNSPANFPYGIRIGSSGGSAVNNIGIPGQLGFGVGICPGPLPSGMTGLSGYNDPSSDNYGNYQYSDGSIMVWIPAFWYKYGTGSNGLGVNVIDVKAFDQYASVVVAATDGYALHRAFYDGGAIQPGVFVDKYQCSNNGGTASSVKNGNPLSSGSSHNSFSGLTGAPTDEYGGAIDAAKTRGANFFCNTRFIYSALAFLSFTHASNSTSATYCAWYWEPNIFLSFPRGNNNNALGDVIDPSISYVSDGFSNCGKTGSANLFARTTHNGQNSGVADLNGNMFEITPGLSSDATNLYILNINARMKDCTSGITLSTDLWGATGLAALYDNLGTSFESWRETGVDRTVYYWNSTQIFSEATSGNSWNWAGAGGMLTTGWNGINFFSQNAFYDYLPSYLCPVSGGYWGFGTDSGIFSLYLANSKFNTDDITGFRSALYL